MEHNPNENVDQGTDKKVTFVEPKVYLSKDRNYITLVLPGDIIVRKPCNYFKAVMGLSFERMVR